MAMACIVSHTVGVISCNALVNASKRTKSRVQPSSSFIQQNRSNAEKYLFHRHNHVHQFCGSDSSCEVCEMGAVRPGIFGSFELSRAVVPMLAIALVGSVQPPVQAASEWEKLLDWVDDATMETYSPYSGDDAYKDLVQRMKEKRTKKTFTAPTNENSDAAPSTFSSPLPSPPPSFDILWTPVKAQTQNIAPPESNQGSSPFSIFSRPPPLAGNTAPADSKPGSSPFSMFAPSAPQKAPAMIDPPIVQKFPEKAAEDIAAVEVEKEKTHGYLPLFATQLLLLVATFGGGFVLLTTPQSKWGEFQKTLDGYLEKVAPMFEDGWSKAQPIAVQAQQKVQELATKAKPFVGKAWEASKPMAAKIVEASKPILQKAQAKAMELLQQAKSE